MFIDQHKISIPMMRVLKLSDGCCSSLSLIDGRSKQFAGQTEVVVSSDPQAQKPESLASLSHSNVLLQHPAMHHDNLDPEDG